MDTPTDTAPARERMAAATPSFREYERLTTRIIPVVRLVEVR